MSAEKGQIWPPCRQGDTRVIACEIQYLSFLSHFRLIAPDDDDGKMEENFTSK
jgi:hypothetical protein